VVTDVSKESSASIFKDQTFQEDIWSYSASNKASHPRKLNPQQHRPQNLKPQNLTPVLVKCE
jgi:hypothetical protein